MAKSRKTLLGPLYLTILPSSRPVQGPLLSESNTQDSGPSPGSRIFSNEWTCALFSNHKDTMLKKITTLDTLEQVIGFIFMMQSNIPIGKKQKDFQVFFVIFSVINQIKHPTTITLIIPNTKLIKSRMFDMLQNIICSFLDQ